MPILIKNELEIEKMRRANKIIAEMLLYLESEIKPGITTKHLDNLAFNFLKKHNVTPNFLNYHGFPGTICASVEEELIHGIPSDKKFLEEGQIVSLDTGCIYQGYHADAARTFAVGKISKEKQKLIDVTKQAFFEAVKILKKDVRIGDIGYTIQSYVEKNGYAIVRDFTGHGIGKSLHEDPFVPNYGTLGKGLRLKSNTTIAIEPMVNSGTHEVEVLKDNWTVVAKDRKPCAHYENTVLITDDACEILSL